MPEQHDIVTVTALTERVLTNVHDLHEGVTFARNELRRVARIARRRVTSNRIITYDEQERLSLAMLSALARLDGSS